MGRIMDFKEDIASNIVYFMSGEGPHGLPTSLSPVDTRAHRMRRLTPSANAST